MRINLARIFCQAIEQDAKMPPEMPDIEGQAADAVPGDDPVMVALGDLHAARDGETDVHEALKAWKEELKVGQAS